MNVNVQTEENEVTEGSCAQKEAGRLKEGGN